MAQSSHIQVSPSILSADFGHLEREVKAAQDGGADLIHCDIMDGHFVPNITFGPMVVETVKRYVTIPLDVHLMIENPLAYIDDFCNAGASILTVHAEACSDLGAVLARIRSHNVRVGVSVNPDKPVSLFLNHLPSIDLVLLMSVFAGFGGQKFIPETLTKISEVAAAVKQQTHSIDIEVDGGINGETAFACAQQGANVFVAGSFVFGKGADYGERIGIVRAGAIKGMTENQIVQS